MIRTKVFKWKQPSHQNSNGIIRAYLEKQGKLIGPYDMQIVAQGMTRDLTIVTNNHEELSRIPWIRIEDWTKS